MVYAFKDIILRKSACGLHQIAQRAHSREKVYELSS